MSRPLRIEYEDAYYHVMNRGWRKSYIFKQEIEYKAFLKTLKDACLQYEVYVNAFCLMGNHYHLLVHTPKANLAMFMRQVNGVYGQKYNIINKTEGAVFRGRYKSVLVEDGKSLLRIMRYIHLNPVRAGIKKKTNQYRWSSHRNYMNKKDEKWLQVNQVLRLLKIAGGKYPEYLHQEDEEVSLFFKEKNIESIFGDKDFVDYVYAKNFKRLNSQNDVSQKRLVCSMALVKKIKFIILEEYGLSEIEFYNRRKGYENVPFQICVYLIRKITQLTFNELAKELKFQSGRSVESCYNRFKNKILMNNALENNVNRLEKRCSYEGT